MERLTARQVAEVNLINTKTKKMLLGNKLNQMIDFVNETATEGTPVNAVNASKILTLAATLDGETVTINNPAVPGVDVYEFCADTEQTKTAPTNIAVNITASTVKATDTLTLPTQPSSGDTMTIGTKTYTFVPAGTAGDDGEISIGSDLATAKLAIVGAINGEDGRNLPHPLVTASAFNVNVCTITARVGGVAGNSIATTETFTAVGNVFSAVALATGANCSGANAVTALVAAMAASDTQGVGGSDGAGDTVPIVADVAGVIGNAIVIGETLANGSFAAGAVLLSGGVDGTLGTIGQRLIDASYEYRCTANNTTAGKNWRRISLGTAY